MMSEGQRLAEIRALLASVAPGRWMAAVDDEGEFVEAAGPMGELLPVARLHPGASADEKRLIIDAPEIAGFLLGLVDRAIVSFASRAEGAPAGRTSGPDARSGLRPEAEGQSHKDYAAEAAMKCAEPAFKAFLEAEHGLERPLTDDRCAQRVRTLCGVTSRAEFNRRDATGDAHGAQVDSPAQTENRAADAWVALRKGFEGWKKRGRG